MSHPGKAQSSSHRRSHSSQQACHEPPTLHLQWSQRGLHYPGSWICPPDCHCKSRNQRSGYTAGYQRGSRWHLPHKSFWWWLVHPRWSAHRTAGPHWCSQAQKIHHLPWRLWKENESNLPEELTNLLLQTAYQPVPITLVSLAMNHHSPYQLGLKICNQLLIFPFSISCH